MNRNYLDIYIDEVAANKKLRCHTLSQQSNTLTGLIEDVPIFCLSNKIVTEDSLIKQIRFGKIEQIQSTCFNEGRIYDGKLLVTFMLDGKIKEIKCNTISKNKGKLILNSPERIISERTRRLIRSHIEEYELASDFLLKHSYGTYIGNEYHSWLYYDSLDIIRIEPYPEEKEDDISYFFRYDIPIGMIHASIYILDKEISIYGQSYSGTFCVGTLIFPSITEMLDRLNEWRRWSKEGYYQFEMSEIEYSDNYLHGEFTINSNTFTYMDLIDKLGFEICRYEYKKDDDSYYDFKEWQNDAYEGYSPEYLGLD